MVELAEPASVSKRPDRRSERSLSRAGTLAIGLAAFWGAAGCTDRSPVAPATVTVSTPAADRTNSEFEMPEAATAIRSLAGLPMVMAVPTYDGSGEAVHPDVVTFPEEWNGHKFWSAFTPYANSAIKLENPSLLESDNGEYWRAPTGNLNPLVTTQRGHLSDPDMIFERSSQQLWMYYREVELAGAKQTHVADRVWRTTSSDGSHWSEPEQVVVDAGRYVVSPSIVQDTDGQFRMYQVDAGPTGCSSTTSRLTLRRSENGLNWSAPVSVNFKQTGYLPWHLDVQYLPSRGEYWALVAAYPASHGCHASSLFLATSRDGLQWTTYPRAILSPREFLPFSTTVYRSTFSYASSDSLTIWFSGARQVRRGTKRAAAVLRWGMAVSHTTGQALLTRVQSSKSSPPLAPAADRDARPFARFVP